MTSFLELWFPVRLATALPAPPFTPSFSMGMSSLPWMSPLQFLQPSSALSSHQYPFTFTKLLLSYNRCHWQDFSVLLFLHHSHVTSSIIIFR
jgi:hypothetical protein